MPVIIPFISAIVTAMGVTGGVVIAGTAIAYATIIAYAIVIAGAVAYASSVNSRLKNSLKNFGGSQGRDIMARDPLAYQRWIYGQILVTGPIVFMRTRGAKNEKLHFVIAMAGHEVEELGDVYVNDNELITLDGAGNAVGKYAGFFRADKHTGHPGQMADSNMMASFPGVWTADHRLQGIAYLHAEITYSETLYPNGYPTIKVMVKGKKVYDPRDGSQNPNTPSTWKWSANGALCTADFLNDKKFGRGIRWARLDAAGLANEANIADEMITLTDGVTQEHRYEIHGCGTADQTPDAVCPDLCTAMAGRIVETGGIYGVQVGAYRAPTITLNDDDIVSALAMQTLQSRKELSNGIRGSFISPANGWSPADVPAVVGKLAVSLMQAGQQYVILIPGTTNFTALGAPDNNVGTFFTATGAGTGTGKVDPYLGQDNNIRLWNDCSLPFTLSASMAQRIFKITLVQMRHQIVLSGQWGMKAFGLACGDTVRITRPSLGFTNKLFEVVDWGFTQVDGPEGEQNGDVKDNLTLSINLTLRSTDPTVYDWNNGEETAENVSPDTDLPNPQVVAAPASLTVLADSSTAYFQTGGAFVPRLKVTWPQSNDIFVLEGGKYVLEYKKHASPDWIQWMVGDGAKTLDYILDVEVGQTYDVQLKFRNTIGASSAFTQRLNYGVAGDVAQPDPPTGVTATAGSGKVISLAWNASPEVDLMEYYVYKSTLGAGPFTRVAKVASNRFVDVDVSIGLTYYYYVTAVDYTENESGASSIVNATTVAVGGGGVDTTPPTDPSPATKTAQGAYNGGDGTVFAFLQFTVDTAFGAGLNVLYRLNGDPQWQIAAQLEGSAGAVGGVRITELAPNATYEVATVAFSNYGIQSNIVTATASPFLTSNKTSGPNGPSNIVPHPPSSANPAPSTFIGAARAFVCSVTYDDSPDRDVAFYEWGISGVAGLAPISVSGLAMNNKFYYSSVVTSPQYLWMRAADRTLNRSTWVDSGYNLNAYISLSGGNLQEQNSFATELTSLTTGTLAPEVNIRVPRNIVVTLTGGSTTETFNLSVAGYGFTHKPDINGGGISLSDSNIAWSYQWDAVASTSTNAVLAFRTLDGSALPAGDVRISTVFEQIT